MKTILALLLVLATVSCSSTSPATFTTAPSPALADIDAFAAKVVQTIPEVPSVALAVVHDGQRHVRAFGLADVDKKVPASTQTGYYIGSTTKAFTGLTAAILAERGKIDLDAPLTTYLPEVKFKEGIDPQKVTLRRLMSHTMTIENQPIVFRTAWSGDHTSATLVKLLADSKPRDPAFRYDNLGYVIAGLVFERVTGRTWQQLHDELVFTPLGMRRATAYMSEAVRAPMAEPYEVMARGAIEALSYRKNDRMMHAAGGTVLTPEDLARWLEANLTGSKVDGKQVIPAGAVAEIQKAQTTIEKPRGPFNGGAYGFGWYRGTLGDDVVLFHGGGFEGWRSLFSLMPGRGLAVGVLTNSGVSNPITALITSYAYDRLREKPGVDTEYAEKLAKLRTEFDTQKARIVEDAQKRAQRPWQLSRPNSAYAGRYENPLYGTLEIAERNGKLWATIGTMQSVLEAFTEPETARVELIPTSGEVLRFVPEGVQLRDQLFTRK